MLPIYLARNFTPDGLELIKEMAESYKAVNRMLNVRRYPGFEKDLGKAMSKCGEAKNEFMTVFDEILESESEQDKLIEAGRLLVQIYATEREIAEIYEKEVKEDFLYAGMSLLKDAAVMGIKMEP